MIGNRGAMALGLGWLLCGAAAAAHEFWVAPESFTPAPGAEIALALEVGEMLDGASYPANPSRSLRFTYAAGSGTAAPVAAQPGSTPAGSAVAAPGLGQVVYESGADLLTYSDWQDFLDYIAYEGLEARAAEHLDLGFPRTGFTEAYYRAAKALVQSGPVTQAGGLPAVGLPLELVAEANPYALQAGDTLPVRLYWVEEPLADHPVALFWRDAAGTALREMMRSDADGRLLVPLRPGMMLLNAVELRPAREGIGFEWLRVWASLTFAVP